MTLSAAPAVFGELVVCVRCMRGVLSLQRAGWICGACGAGYPVVGGLPWLFRDPQDALLGWRTRSALLLQSLRDEAAALEREMAARGTAGTLQEATRRRLDLLRRAQLDHAARLEQLLAPLGPFAAAKSGALRGLGTRLPVEQGLTNYYVNIHRDWAWGDDENAAAVQEVQAVLGRRADLGRALVLGGGAGRLAYDLHRATSSECLIMTDFNPLLLFVAREMYAGRELSLYEFPIAPRGPQDVAVLRSLRAPEPARAGIALVAADALDAPFALGRFDTVVTPWFIDIIGESFTTFARRVNAWLKPGGCWVNTGSLAFNLPNSADRIGLDEVCAALPEAGFQVPDVRESTLPYMRSPASRHARLETVVTWRATKIRSVDTPPARAVPDWLADRSRPVPRSAALEVEQLASRVHAFMLALVNGERSIAEMARLVAEQRLLPPDEAEPAVRQFLQRALERTEQRTSY